MRINEGYARIFTTLLQVLVPLAPFFVVVLGYLLIFAMLGVTLFRGFLTADNPGIHETDFYGVTFEFVCAPKFALLTHYAADLRCPPNVVQANCTGNHCTSVWSRLALPPGIDLQHPASLWDLEGAETSITWRSYTEGVNFQDVGLALTTLWHVFISNNCEYQWW